MMTQEPTNSNRSQSFDIRDHLDKLTDDGGSHGPNERSYHCPICNAQNFKVTIAGPKAGAYLSRGCSCMDTDEGKQRIIDTLSPKWEKPIREESSQTYIYDGIEKGSVFPLCRVQRRDDGKGKRRFWQEHWDGKRWSKGLTDEVKERLHLYRIFEPINQDAIKHGEPLLIVEGEGKVTALHKLGIAATCALGGGGKWTDYGYPNYLEDLEGAAVVICPDRDEPGIKHADMIAEDFPGAPWLYPNPTSFQWGRSLPKAKGFDIADWINDDGATKEMILGAIEPRRPEPEQVTTLPPGEKPQYEKKDTRPQADQLLDLVLSSNISLFITPDETAYIDIHNEGTRRTLPLRAPAFKKWLQYEFYQLNKKSATSEAVTQAVNTLESQATFTGEKREVYVRIASHEGRTYLDLADDSWKAIEISPEGWRLVSDAPVRFNRAACAPLPVPVEGGQVEDIKNLCQFDEEQWTIILTLLIQCLKSEKGYPILLLHGGFQSGKSTITKTLKKLVDPSLGKPRKNVGDIRDFAIHATRRHVLTIDNLSGISADQSDILCTASTGGGHSQRTLQTDTGETVIDFCNLLILNGIDTIATRSDLLSRCFPITIYPPKKRLSEAEYEATLEALHPQALGALLTIASKVLAVLPEVKGTYQGNRERFMGFVELGLAVEKVMGWEKGRFLRAVEETREETHETALESSPVGQAILDFMEYRTNWTGSTNELLGELRNQVGPYVWQSSKSGFPKNAIVLSKTLTRLASDLRALGIDYQTSRSNKTRFVTLQVLKSSSPSSPSSPTPLQLNLDKGFSGDDKSDRCGDDDFYRHHVSALPDGGDDESDDGDDDKKSLSPLKPLPSMACDDGDDGDDDFKTLLATEVKEGEEWKYWDEVDTVVKVLKRSNNKARIRVPGETRDRWVDAIELTEGK